MIIGIGIDIVEIERLVLAVKEQPRLINRILTSDEIVIYQGFTNEHRRMEWLAGRFAAKEAFAKALNTGIGSDLSFQDIMITNQENGQPQIDCSKLTQKQQVHLSISHEKHYAVAQVLIEG